MPTITLRQERFDAVGANLMKVAIFEMLLGLATAYLAFLRYSAEEGAFLGELIIALRILPFMLFYLALKCFLIRRYLRQSVEVTEGAAVL